jgi:hypothetical protein
MLTERVAHVSSRGRTVVEAADKPMHRYFTSLLGFDERRKKKEMQGTNGNYSTGMLYPQPGAI